MKLHSSVSSSSDIACFFLGVCFTSNQFIISSFWCNKTATEQWVFVQTRKNFFRTIKWKFIARCDGELIEYFKYFTFCEAKEMENVPRKNVDLIRKKYKRSWLVSWYLLHRIGLKLCRNMYGTQESEELCENVWVFFLFGNFQYFSYSF